MRHALLALPLLAGCLIEGPSTDDTYYPPPDNSGWGSGWGGGGGDTDYGCHQDSECGGSLVCARDGSCLSATSVRVIHVNWTIRGLTPSETTCANARDLSITFSDPYGAQFGFAPVPCRAGRYTVDKFPTTYDRVDLTRAGEYSGGAGGRFDANGDANLDLPY